jgi:DNA-binding PadR family transcriptional regulator
LTIPGDIVPGRAPTVAEAHEATAERKTMGRGSILGEFEQLVLLAVARLGGDGYGVTIRKEIASRARRDVTIGAVYATLSRLEEKGYASSWEGEAEPRRGGRARRHYRVEPEGVRALHVARGMVDRMWDGVDFGSGPA